MIILIHGLPLSLKSTMASDMAKMLQCGLVATGFFGIPTYNKTKDLFISSRNKRYKACSEITHAYVNRGWPVIVEGNFSIPRWRSPIIQLCQDNHIVLITIRCWCSNSKEIEKRYVKRKETSFELDRDATSNAYQEEQKQEVLINKEEVKNLEQFLQLDVDTGTWEMQEISEKEAGNCLFIKKALQKWIYYMKTNYE